MQFQNLSTANTFLQWLATEQQIVGFVNDFEANAFNPLYSNTNINILQNATVGGNVNIAGLYIVGDGQEDNLEVAGNLSIDGVSTINTGSLENLFVTGNIETLNVTTALRVPGELSFSAPLNTNVLHTSNLTINGTFDFNNTNVTVQNLTVLQNVADVNTTNVNIATNLNLHGQLNVSSYLITDTLTANLIVADIVDIDTLELTDVSDTITIGTTLDVTGNSTFANTTTDYGNFETANVTRMVGPAKTNIYNTINLTTAFVTVDSNIAAFTGYVLALG